MATRARHFEAALAGFRNNSGVSLAGGKLQFYVSGTSTPKNAYTDREKTQPVTEVTLDSNGRSEVFGDGWYNIKLLDTDDSVLDTFEYVYLQRASFTVETKTESFTATTDVDVYLVDTTNGNVVVSYPQASDIEYPIEVAKKTDDANTVTIDPYGTETVNGAASFTLDAPNQSVMVASDGANLYTLGAFVNTAVTITTEATAAVKGKTRYATESEVLIGTETAAAITPAGMNAASLMFGATHYGLLLSNNSTDASHDVDISSGACRDSTNSKIISLSTSITKQIDAAWAGGTNAGGFPSGLTLETSVSARVNSTAYSLGDLIKADYSPWWWECTTAGTAASSQPAGYGTSSSPVTDGTAVFTRTAPEWYRVFVIASQDLTLIDAGFDTDASATNLFTDATDYSLFRQVGWVLNDGSGAIVKFHTDVSGGVAWDTSKVDRYESTAGLTSGVLTRVTAPPETIASITVHSLLQSAGATSYYSVQETRQTDTAQTITNARAKIVSGGVEFTRGSLTAPTLTDDVSEVRIRTSHANQTAEIRTSGYTFLWG